MIACLLSALLSASTPWEVLQPGLELGTFQGPPAEGEARIHALRVDPARFTLELRNADAPGEGARRSARQWALRAGAVAAINPSMFAPSGRSVSLMRTPGHVSNGRLTRDKSVLVFGPRKEGLPAMRLLDRECDDVEALLPLYESAAQSIRMLSCKGRNVWAEQPRRFSAAAVGQDDQGRLLLVHARSAYSMHELVDALRALPLGLRRLMYVEGGPEAQLYVRAGGREHEFVGTRELGLRALDSAVGSFPLPNALVVMPRGR
jgi:hypothetical protein